MKKYYVFEDNYDVEIFESKGEAVRHYETPFRQINKGREKKFGIF